MGGAGLLFFFKKQAIPRGKGFSNVLHVFLKLELNFLCYFKFFYDFWGPRGKEKIGIEAMEFLNKVLKFVQRFLTLLISMMGPGKNSVLTQHNASSVLIFNRLILRQNKRWGVEKSFEQNPPMTLKNCRFTFTEHPLSCFFVFLNFFPLFFFYSFFLSFRLD